MSNLEHGDGSDSTLKSAPPASVVSEAVITAPEQQATLTGNKSTADNYLPSNIDLVEETQSTDGPRYANGFQDLVYRTPVDLLESGIGLLDFKFDSITEKMSGLLGRPQIHKDHQISIKDLKDTVLHPDLEKRFSKDEVKSIRLMANQAHRLIDEDKSAKFSVDMAKKDVPVDKIFISKNSVTAQGYKLGVLRDA